MSTRVTALTRVSAACRELVNYRLNIAPDLAIDFGQVNAVLDAEQTDLSALQSMVGSAEISGVLGTLAPTPFSRARAMLTEPGDLALDAQALLTSARAELAEAAAAASHAIEGAIRDITAETFAEAGADLSYTVSVCRGAAMTGLELRRPNEVMLLRVHDGGFIECDHAGLADQTCADRQSELEEAAARLGVTLTGRKG